MILFAVIGVIAVLGLAASPRGTFGAGVWSGVLIAVGFIELAWGRSIAF